MLQGSFRPNIGRSRKVPGAVLLQVLVLPLVAQDPGVPVFELGFAAPAAITGAVGDVVSFDVLLTLSSRDNPTPRGAQGWSASFGIEGGTLELLTFDGVIASTVYLEDDDKDPSTPPILRDPYLQDLGKVKSQSGFSVSGLGFHTSDSKRKGGVLAMVLSFFDVKRLQPVGTEPIARVRVSTLLGAGDSTVRLYYEDGFRPADGMYVGNTVTFDGGSVEPIKGDVTVPVHSEQAVPFKLGDMNADGKQDISDAVFGLSFLFLGGREPPCKKSMDLTGDNQVDISDPIFLLNFLFLHTATPREPYRQCGLDPLSSQLPCVVFPSCAL